VYLIHEKEEWMSLYNMLDKNLTELKNTSYALEGLNERYDLQEAIKNNIKILAPDCLIISEEFSDWEDSKRRIDLLAIDKQANLVVIELKRDDIGAHMELQALRYAAMISTMSFAKACECYDKYLQKDGLDVNAKDAILDFIEFEETELVDFGKDIRIVLASANFGKELTTTAIWLRDKGVDIRCVRLTPYNFKGEILINAEQIIPVPELEEYQVRFREKRTEQIVSSQKSEKDYSEYKYNGVIYNKRRLALELFTDWINKHNPENFHELKNKLGEVLKSRTIALANEISKERENRFYIQEDNLIELPSGELVAISNQWGIGNINRLLDFVRRDGFIIDKVK
jgi:hypothetical protein